MRPVQVARSVDRAATLICVVLVGLATLIAALLVRAVPEGQPYDEPSHMGTVLQYAHGHPLPVMGNPGVTYEAQMGPVYYAVSALPARLVGDGDQDLHALFTLRFGWLVLVPILGMLTYRLARRLRATPLASALAAGVVTLNPSMLAIASSVQNDYLCIVLSSGGALVGVRSLRRDSRASWSVITGVCLGFAVLTKVTAGALVVTFVIAALTDTRSSWLLRCRRVLGAVIAALVVSGWWFMRNLLEYGDPTGSSGVHRTGVSFPPLEFHGLISIGSWIRSLISYGFAPTEYYRNAFHAPVAVQLVAGLMFLATVAIVGLMISGWLRARHTQPQPEIVFAASAVLVTIGAYAITAWTMQAIAPRLMFVVAPLGVALLARYAGRPEVRSLLIAFVVTFSALDGWLLIAVTEMVANPVLWSVK